MSFLVLTQACARAPNDCPRPRLGKRGFPTGEGARVLFSACQPNVTGAAVITAIRVVRRRGDKHRGHDEFRVESSHPISGLLWPVQGVREWTVSSRSLAVALAVKSSTPAGQEIRVVHVPTGEVLFRKEGPSRGA